MHVVGLVLHPERDCDGAVSSVLNWAARRRIEVLGVDVELSRIACAATPVPAEELRDRADLLVSLGGDGTMLRAMRLADGQRSPVLGVNLGKLGFLAEVDVPELPDALSAIDSQQFTTEPRLAVDAMIGDRVITAFNDIAFVRHPGQHTAEIAVRAEGSYFVGYAADALVVATPTGSTAYSFSAGGPIVSPAVEALLVTPVAPHSAYNRGLIVSPGDQVGLDILPDSGQLAVEADGVVCANVGPGDHIEMMPRPGAAYVVRLGLTTFYERARRKLRLADSAEIPVRAVTARAPVTWPSRTLSSARQRGEGLVGYAASPAHPGDGHLRVLAEFLGHPGHAPLVAERADGRGDRLLDLRCGWLVGGLQRRREQRVGAGGGTADAGTGELVRHEPHRGPPCITEV